MSENELTAVTVETSLVQPTPSDDPHRVTNHGLRNIFKDTDHRKLAICSIICGLSCCGIMSLVYSVKARETRRHEDCQETRKKVERYSKQACRWGIRSIVAWVVLIFIFPLLIGFLSYIVTFID